MGYIVNIELKDIIQVQKVAYRNSENGQTFKIITHKFHNYITINKRLAY